MYIIDMDEEIKFNCLQCGTKNQKGHVTKNGKLICEECGSKHTQSKVLTRINSIMNQDYTNRKLGIDLDIIIRIMAKYELTAYEVANKCNMTVNELNRILSYLSVPTDEEINNLNIFIYKYEGGI